VVLETASLYGAELNGAAIKLVPSFFSDAEIPQRLGGERLGGERLGGERLGGERLGGERQTGRL
jgi:hypothetical protein